MNLFLLGSELKDRATTLQWARELGLIPSSRYCNTHKQQMVLDDSRGVCGEF
ncbi:hypothetical protein X777_06638 [Ooceraea biroi]|uniref:Uncharacterized protein n=1 Tax=Ooceraea biroi TaxID=2015173 RepID=A0A026WDR2_OOCBI|nr:hypothetical protein X777_06638 [Ooceraea biroi]